MNGGVLIVDDDDLAVRTLRAVLGRAGHQVESAGSVCAALDRLDEWTPACVVLDRRLPDGDGLALAADVRTRFGTDVRIVVLSGDPVEPADPAGPADVVLLKPVGARQVIDAVTG